MYGKGSFCGALAILLVSNGLMFLHIDDKRAEIVIKDYATYIGLSVLVNESPNGGCLTVHYEVADLSAVDGHTFNLTID